jgi:hypothetical protein
MKLIPLTRGQNAIIDDDDFESVSKHKWQAWTSRTFDSFYATSSKRINTKTTMIKMHRLIAGVIGLDGVYVDHINGNGLDNRRSNLRICSHSENMKNCKRYTSNKSGYKGVGFHNGKWRARINIDRKSIFLGHFSTAEEAHAAYCEAAKRLYGEFARFE